MAAELGQHVTTLSAVCAVIGPGRDCWWYMAPTGSSHTALGLFTLPGRLWPRWEAQGTVVECNFLRECVKVIANHFSSMAASRLDTCEETFNPTGHRL